MITTESKSVWRALTTVNAPLPTHIEGNTLIECLRLENKARQWRPHVRSFFREVGVDTIMDMVVEGSVTFDNLSKAVSFWEVDEDCENARWIREMAPISMAEADGDDLAGGGFGRH